MRSPCRDRVAIEIRVLGVSGGAYAPASNSRAKTEAGPRLWRAHALEQPSEPAGLVAGRLEWPANRDVSEITTRKPGVCRPTAPSAGVVPLWSERASCSFIWAPRTSGWPTTPVVAEGVVRIGPDECGGCRPDRPGRSRFVPRASSVADAAARRPAAARTNAIVRDMRAFRARQGRPRVRQDTRIAGDAGKRTKRDAALLLVPHPKRADQSVRGSRIGNAPSTTISGDCWFSGEGGTRYVDPRPLLSSRAGDGTSSPRTAAARRSLGRNPAGRSHEARGGFATAWGPVAFLSTQSALRGA